MRSLLLFAIYLAILGAHPVRLAPAGHDLTVSLIASDTDSDDDVVGGPCLHCQSLDDGFQNFDRAVSPAVSFRAESHGLDGHVPPASDRLDDGGLFRPPRPSLV